MTSMDTAELITHLCGWLDEADAARGATVEAATWARIAKIGEEVGEVVAAYVGAIGQNPRKGVTHSMDDVRGELLDVALTALVAYEHASICGGTSMDALALRVAEVSRRATTASPHKFLDKLTEADVEALVRYDASACDELTEADVEALVRYHRAVPDGR